MNMKLESHQQQSSKWYIIFVQYRLFELIFFWILTTFTLVVLEVQPKQFYIPDIISIDKLTGESIVIANNTLHSYPITFNDGTRCTPGQFESCVVIKNNNNNNNVDISSEEEDICCDYLFNDDTDVHNTVSDVMLYVWAAGLPIVMLLIRSYYLKILHMDMDCYRFIDVFLGLNFGSTLTVLITSLVKYTVGRPRPIFYGLQFLASYNDNYGLSLLAKAQRSFPSGHASFSMASLFNLSLIYVNDIERLCIKYPQKLHPVKTILISFAFWPMGIALWIGVSRITDFWHFQDDVTCGWVLGILLGYMGFKFVCCHCSNLKNVNQYKMKSEIYNNDNNMSSNGNISMNNNNNNNDDDPIDESYRILPADRTGQNNI